MERKYLSFLTSWLNNPMRKPLLVYGARQVGKTTLIYELFGKTHFNKLIYIDFKIDVAERVFIKNNVDARKIVQFLSIRNNMEIDANTLIIFDEIQECISCLTSLKYFEQFYKDVPIIASGSLIRTKLKQMEYNGSNIKLDPEIDANNQDGNNNYMFPTGKIDILNMYPMTFNEYLKARNEKLYDYLSNAYKNKDILDDEIHRLALNSVYEYIALGGMPEVVDTYIKTGSYFSATSQLKNLYSNYLNDFPLFQISQETINRTRNIFDNIFLQLNKDNKNFKISLIEKNKRYRDYMYPFDWLETGKIINKSHLLKETVHLPLRQSDESLYRVYTCDPGLLSLQTGLSIDNIITNINKNDYRGLLFENFVAIILADYNIPLFYWCGKSSSELEFLITINDSIIPIDVKKGDKKLASLANYRNHNKNEYAIKVSSNKYGYNNDIKLLTLPLYYFEFFIEENENKIAKKTF